jgi:hypothetical protein
MSFVDHVISQRQFAARYRNFGRPMLANLADLYCTDLDQAERWADEIDREDEQQIAAVRPPEGGGIAGVVGSPEPATPAHPQS